MDVRQIGAVGLLLVLLGGTSVREPGGAPRELYAAPKGTCDGFPRLDIGTMRGMCAGLVLGPTRADRSRPISLPRSLVQLDETTWLVSDLGAWDRAVGAVWELTVLPREPVVARRLLEQLNLPHAMSRGPDGLIYIGEMSRIFRFDPQAVDPSATVQTVIAGLPDNQLHEHRHPLSKFVFAPDGALLVNIGAPSDQCLDVKGRALGKTCPESEQGEPVATSAPLRRSEFCPTRQAPAWPPLAS